VQMQNYRFFSPAPGFLVFYMILWASCTLVHYILLGRYGDLGAGFTDLSARLLALDAFISQTSLFLLLLPLWFLVRFRKKGKDFSLAGIVNALVGGGLLIGIWYFVMREGLAGLLYAETGAEGFFRNTLGIRMAFGFLAGLAVYHFFLACRLHREAREAIERQVELESLVQQTELQALKNQLNPHFIYNSLNAISSLTLTDAEKARDMVVKLSDFLRYALKQDALQLTSLEKEMNAVELYLQIEKVRFGEKLNHRFRLEEHDKNLELPGLILQPLFENAVKHGIQQLPGQSGPSFRVIGNEKETILEVSNHFDPAVGRFKGEGVGLENIRNRLRLHYGNGQLLQVEKRGHEFFARLHIPKPSR
jgi:two-component system, LytTR family, sensor kinase